MAQTILVVDFGGQYNQLIARRVRESCVYSEIVSYKKAFEAVREKKPAGIILTGGPNSVYLPDSPTIGKELFEMGIPVLGICYGAQLMSHVLGGKVSRAAEREYGKTEVFVNTSSKLFQGVSESTICWMSHNDYIETPAPGFVITAHTDSCPVAAAEDAARGLYLVQFHPEVLHTQQGALMLSNFVHNVCGCGRRLEDGLLRGGHRGRPAGQDRQRQGAVRSVRRRGFLRCRRHAGQGGGQAADLRVRGPRPAAPGRGLLRQDEGDQVESVFGPEGPYDLNFIRVNAQQRFYDKLAGVEEPEKKRKIIGEEFIRVFEEEAKKIGTVDFLVQGTIYPDVVESGLGGESAVIKSHHNVGGLPDYVDFKEIVEPLRDLFKDEVRQAGRELGIPEYLVSRQPFPGPGLAVRIIGAVTPEKVKIVQQADAIYREEVEAAGAHKGLGQYFAALTNMRSVGVMGDERTYDYAIALRAVATADFMTAEAAALPWEVLAKATSRIVNEVPHVNRVLYDCTGKPPATVEFE